MYAKGYGSEFITIDFVTKVAHRCDGQRPEDAVRWGVSGKSGSGGSSLSVPACDPPGVPGLPGRTVAFATSLGWAGPVARQTLDRSVALSTFRGIGIRPKGA